MGKVVFFSRSQLTLLYGQITGHIRDDFDVLHLVYSKFEEDILKEEFNINELTNLKKECEILLKKEVLDYDLIEKIDNDIIKYTNGRFSLNAAIQMDRSFEFLDYQDALLLVQVYYKFWDNYITSNEVEFLVHEPNSLFFNHIAAILLNKHGGKYLTHISVYGKAKYNFMILSGDNANFDEYDWDRREKDEMEETLINDATAFLKKFSENSANLLDVISKKNTFTFRKVFVETLKMTYRSIKGTISGLKSGNNLIDHIENYYFKRLSWYNEFRKYWKTYYFLRFDKFDTKQTYYYYPLHLEPEAVVLYWGDGIYRNQVKLIENIAGQLPPNSFLYVKDHPHAGIYRDYEDYKKIKSIPNVKLLSPSISGKSIIAHSEGVITINGTSGFEAILMGKEVYTFGKAFYKASEEVQHIENIRDLRNCLYKNRVKQRSSKDKLISFVAKYLDNVHSGFTTYFINYHKKLNIEEEENSKKVAHSFKQYFKKSREEYTKTSK